MSTARVVLNPSVRHFAVEHSAEVQEFHQKLPGYRVTPLVAAPRIADRLGVGQVWVKDESCRLDLPAYKALGASWATYRAIEQQSGPFEPWTSVEDLAWQLSSRKPLELVAATEGNHGRAVARMARWLGMSSHIFMPSNAFSNRVLKIKGEGARVTIVDGTYDAAVEAAAALDDNRHLVISDTAWDGYEDVPRWVVDGYETMYREIDSQLAEGHFPPPDGVAVQMGVGALASSAVRHYRRPGLSTAVVGVEPCRAACILDSIEAGKIVEVKGPYDPLMGGLNCGRPSRTAWPFVSGGLSACVAIPTPRALEAVQELARVGIRSSPSGSAGLGGLFEFLGSDASGDRRRALGWGVTTSLLVIATEAEPVGTET